MTKNKHYEIQELEQNKTTVAFIDGTPSVRRAIIDIGCSIYDNIDLFINMKKNENDNTLYDELQIKLQKVISERDQYVNDIMLPKIDEIERLKRQLEENDQHFTKKIKIEREYYELHRDKTQQEINDFVNMSLKPKDVEITFLKNYITENTTEWNRQKEDEINRIEYHNNRYVETLKEQIVQLQRINDYQHIQLSEHDRKKNMNVVKIGQIGETYVEQYISEHFIEGTLKNTAKTGGQGDLHFNYKNCDILLEVKNKDRITPDDISKFERDIQDTDCVGGVFVSIKTNVNVPCHSVYDVEWIHGKPIIYITNFEGLPDMLYLAIKTIYYYFVYKQDQEQHTNTTEIQNKLIKYKQDLDHIIDNVKLFKPILEDASFNVSKLNESILRMQYIIKNQLQSFFINEDSIEDKLNFILNKIKQKTDEGKSPTYEELIKTPGISKKDIATLGGMKKIRSEYNKKLTQTE